MLRQPKSSRLFGFLGCPQPRLTDFVTSRVGNAHCLAKLQPEGKISTSISGRFLYNVRGAPAGYFPAHANLTLLSFSYSIGDQNDSLPGETLNEFTRDRNYPRREVRVRQELDPLSRRA